MSTQKPAQPPKSTDDRAPSQRPEAQRPRGLLKRLFGKSEKPKRSKDPNIYPLY